MMHELDRHRLERELDAWDPESDLSDELAAALDADPALRARFDARFAPVAEVRAPDPLPAGLAERVLPTNVVALQRPEPRSWRPWTLAGLGTLAATALFGLTIAGGAGTVATLSLTRGPADAPAVVAGVPPMPFPASAPAPEPATGEASARISAGLAHAGKLGGDAPADPNAMLDALGYVAGNREGEISALGYVGRDAGIADRTVALEDGRFATLDVDLPPRDPFAGITVNPWNLAATTPLSTFSLDVDRGSWSWTRRQLREGFLPAPQAVRTEEFVNALRYDPPRPESGPFAVQFEGSPSPFSGGPELVRITLSTAPPVARAPVHLTFLVDTSGSMAGPDRLPLVQQALGLLVNQLGGDDTVAIVAYAGSAGVVLEPTSADRKDTILGALGRLQAGGSTAMGAGIDLAYKLAEQTKRPGHGSRVVIASDGDANVGTVATGSLSDAIRQHALGGITLTTLGFGTGNYQDARMEQLADDGDGNYFYVDGIEEARRVFVEDLVATLEVAARDAKVQVAWDPAVVARYRQVGYENRALTAEQFRDDRVDAGEVGAGHVVTAIYEIERVAGATGALGTVSVRGKPPGPDAPSTEWRFDLPAEAMQPTFADASGDHRAALAAAALAGRLRGAGFGSDVPYDDILALAPTRPGHPEDPELQALLGAAARLSHGTCREVALVVDGRSRVARMDGSGRPCR